MKKQKGKFIVLDGIDGCGKGSIIKRLVVYLFDKSKKNHILLTREPYISKYNSGIRRILKESSDPRDYALRLAKLYTEDRKVHAKWVGKELDRGHHVISDRFKYSTLVYQQIQGIPFKVLLKMHKGIRVIPDLVIIIDVPAKIAMNRLNKDSKRNYLEVFEKVEFQKILRNKFLELPKILKKENIVIIKGNRTEDGVFASVKKAVDKLFK